MGKFDEWNPAPKPNKDIVKKKDKKGTLRSYITGYCEECGEYFEKRNDRKKLNKKLCSSCSVKESNAKRKGKILEKARKGKTKTCIVCKKEFYVPPKRSLSAKYCSSKCWGSVKPIPKTFITKPNNSGKNNGRYKDGKRTGERAKQNTPKNKVRKEVINRDGDWCLLCGKPPKGLHLHRVVYGSQGGKYEKENCVQLCSDDHALIHSNKRVFQPLLEEYLKDATKHQLENEPTEPPFYWHDWIWKMRQAKENKQKYE